jgi:tRNA(fMet)-specific endonuclease VapC
VSGFLLDTDVCIDVLRARDHSARERLRAMAPAVSSVTVSELAYGAAHSRDPGRNGDEVRRFLLAVDVLDLDEAAAWRAGEIRHLLARDGTPIGGYDVLIAGHALADDRTLVTRNLREFTRVPGLRVEEW